MRVISGLVAVSVLVALAQPAWALCVIRGGVTSCVRDAKIYYPHVIRDPVKTAPAVNPNTELKTIVLHPDASGENAWVLTPQTANGATILGGAGFMASACEATTGC
jgi:hypothetical protein